ncbi:P-loop containing nucleoside triphosphate hydrolase [Pseudocohnilembus persalinus]|uniref:p-loop containing nucleoside triphosphate hydrolase n=1 Tax=Pseudocohnilembus persalinus TaxID=266149 RepID=A0A0V0QLK6_PSEPJ|nr:P-loop containing nucleoside triphosphate hydrolase [Pseudocohnilembus persalinus]|eukprot:KRX03117.1 P-loop containing nucleoside triphosphate hydrolase [Pseudocohnilembus persalinus]
MPITIEIIKSNNQNQEITQYVSKLEEYKKKLQYDYDKFQEKLFNVQENIQVISIKIAEQMDKSQLTMKIIKQFLKNSNITFQIKNSSEIYFRATIIEMQDQNNLIQDQPNIQKSQQQQLQQQKANCLAFENLEEINSHKVKAELMITNTQYSIDVNDETERNINIQKHEDVKNFHTTIEHLYKIQHFLDLLVKKGYYNIENCDIQMQIIEGNICQLVQKSKALEDDYKQWNDFFDSYMSQEPLLSFISPQTLYQIQEIIYQQEKFNKGFFSIQQISQQLFNLLVVENDQEQEFGNTMYVYSKNFENKFNALYGIKDRKQIIQKVIQIMKANQKLWQLWDIKNEQKNQEKYQIKKVNLKSTDFLDNLTRLIRNNVIIPGQFLFCNNQTQFNDLLLILNRFKYAQFGNRSYYILNIEKLKNSIKNQLFEYIIAMTHEQKKNNLYLFYRDINNNQINSQIPMIEECNVFQQRDLDSFVKTHIARDKIEIVCSQQSGQGKSYYIQQQVRNLLQIQKFQKQCYIKIPIYGDIKKQYLIQKIKQYIDKNPSKFKIFHFDIYSTSEIDISAFYFEFFVTGVLNNNNKEFLVVPQNCKVYIEIQNQNFKIQDEYVSPLECIYGHLNYIKLNNTDFLDRIDYNQHQPYSSIQITLKYLNILKQGAQNLSKNKNNQSIQIKDTNLCKDMKGSSEFQMLKNLYLLLDNKNVNLLFDTNQEISTFEENSKHFEQNLSKIQEFLKYKNQNEWIQSITELQITNENFYKIALIFLRISSNLPVILMGDTGIGKTSLVQLLSKIIQSQVYPLNIHAGIQTDEIINFVKEKIKNQKNNEKTIIFFDEINTNQAVSGIFKEIIIDRTVCGDIIPDNITFIAACNPYIFKQSNLVYLVEIMPDSMYPFIWNYDKLKKNDEDTYIEKIIGNIPQFKNYILKNVKDNTIQMIKQSQEFIRNNYNQYSVSLRELKRFQILFKYFYENIDEKFKFYYKNTQENIYSPFMKQFGYIQYDQKQKIEYVVILSILCCYYLRLDDQNLRQKFLKLAEQNNFNQFNKVMKCEYNDLIQKIKLPPGIAPNISLKENIFALFTCLRTNIPLFILGQPGSSKTLAVNLILSSMRNKKSDNKFFQQLQEVYPNFYQGHLQSTSEKIKKTFDSAIQLQNQLKLKSVVTNQSQNNKNPTEAQVLIVIDEIGLAEQSPYNPLKVLHPLLEPSEKQNQIAFVGISNWSLDASKMNRGICLSKPKLDIHQLNETAVAIYEHLLQNQQDNKIKNQLKQVFESISDIYLMYMQEINKQTAEKSYQPNFHGLRDFYFLIKYISKSVIKSEKKEDGKLDESLLMNLIYTGLVKNFGGNQAMLQKMLDIFQQKYLNYSFAKPQHQDQIKEQLIKENLENNAILDRNLMLISDNLDTAYNQLTSITKDIKKPSKLFVGSNFQDDTQIEKSYEVINQVIDSVQKGYICILINLDDIYQSFYDLLNQNFQIQKVGTEKYFCRISVGAESSKIQVNENFKLVLIQDVSSYKRLDPPLLNRFEKHFISDNIKDYGFLELCQWVDRLNISKKLFTFYNKKILITLYQLYKKQYNDQINTILRECKNDMIKLINLNGLKFLLKNKLSNGIKQEDIEFLERRLAQKNYNSIIDYLQMHPYNNSQKPIQSYIYTSNYKQYKNVFIKKLGEINFNCMQIDIDTIQSERQLTDNIRKYFLDRKNNLLLILYDMQIQDNNKNRLTKIKFIIDEQIKLFKEMQEQQQEFQHINKNIVFIFQINNKTIEEAKNSFKEPCSNCKQENYSLNQCKYLHMNYQGQVFSENWEQVQIDNLFPKFQNDINELIKLDVNVQKRKQLRGFQQFRKNLQYAKQRFN